MIDGSSISYIYYWIKHFLSQSGENLAVGNALYVGDDTDYVQIDATNGITLHGDATVWDELRIAMDTGKLAGVTNPDYIQMQDDGAGSNGVYAYAFDKNTAQELFFSVQMPHAWKEGSDIYFHVHWAPSDTDTGYVIWRLEYTWANIDSAFPTTTTTANIQDSADGTALKHQMTSSVQISGTGKTHSSMIMCRIFRRAASDTYDADAFLLECDFHYEVDSPGGEASLT